MPTRTLASFCSSIVPTSTQRRRAYEAAALTRPSSSAPEKFFVLVATAARSTSGSRRREVRIDAVLMSRIWRRPFSSGKPISTWSSSRPGRRMASSIMSLRFVMPMMRMLLSESTPSILARSWLTTESWTPVESRVEPRDFMIASISSNMTMWSMLSSPAFFCSASASANSSRIFSSDPPTYRSRISGPFTILGSRAFSTLPICRAIKVFPHPGGPYSSIPRTWAIPSCWMMCGG
mmetsp:Transcript_15108/g.47451  ORF Transcript_15108/g.47451 Transcript_15108/m.47451 type:complete len:235 (+) Transcript_15108:610-1314(+)